MKLKTGGFYKELAKKQNGLTIEGEQLRRLQLVLTQMTQDIADVCEACGATYFLIGGNALGAVRHHGAIPWDDDMDIGLLAKDFETFLVAFRKKFGYKYDIYDKNTKRHCSSISYISLKGSVLREIVDNEKDIKGICVSLNKIQNVPDNLIFRLIHGMLCDGLGLLMSCRNIYENRKSFLAFSNGYPEARKVYKVKIVIGWCTKLLTVRGLNKFTQIIQGLCKNEQSEFLNIPTGSKYYFGDMYPRRDFIPPLKVEYEGHMFNVPAHADCYLTKLYGEDYMMLPPEEKREKHACMELKFPE